MRKNLSLWYAFLLIIGVQIPMTITARRTKRRPSIATAFQNPAQEENDLFQQEPIKTANLDKLSRSFESSTREIPQPDYTPKETQSVAEPIENVYVQQDPPTETEKQREETSADQKTDFELPVELQKKAEQELAKIQEAPAEDEKIELQFEDADLQTFVNQIADIFQITFITDDAIEPLPKGTAEVPAQSLKGHKISFKTSNPVSKKEAWNLFITFLNISGFSIVQQPDPSIYRIAPIKTAQRSPLPTYIGVDYTTLPENDTIIRYLYFIENATIEALKGVIPSLQSASAPQPVWLPDQKAFIVTDTAYNIRALMAIVNELDKVTMPQAMSVLKLRQADASDVKKLYDDLTSQTDASPPFRPFGARKQPTAIYFPESARIIAEPRTNSLILLGPKDAIEKIEDFIIKHVDVALDQPYSPLYTYQLQYADANLIADIMNKTTKLGQNLEVGKAGGVRGSDKYLKDMHFTPEPSSNQLIIKGDYQDYLMAKKVIEDLDQPQPQVALDVLILTARLMDRKELGTQLRSKIPGLDGILGQNVKFQTSGLRAGGSPQGIVTNNENSGVNRLLGNLIDLVTQSGVGNTVVTFGQDIFGVWGIFQALQSITNIQIVSNPFLFAANKTKAKVSIGQSKRVVSSEVALSDSQGPLQGFGDEDANLSVEITPQINSDGMIVLALQVNIGEFTNPDDPNDATRIKRLIDTQAIVADREVLALGGLIRDESASGATKTPILGDVPLLGWFFKNKSKNANKDSLLVLISTKIIPPHATSDVNEYTKDRLDTYRTNMRDIDRSDSPKDPIHRLFFADRKGADASVGEFIFDRHQRARRRSRRRKREREERHSKPQAQQLVHNNGPSSRRRRRRGRRRNIPAQETPQTESNVTIAQSPARNSAITSASQEAQSSTLLADKRRRSRSLQSFPAPGEREKAT